MADEPTTADAAFPTEPTEPAIVATATTAPIALPATPAFTHQAQKHGFIGPFGARQIAMGALLVAAVVVALVALTSPLGNTGALAKPDPRPTPFLIGPAAQGLAIGAIAPEFSTQRADGSTFRLTDLDGKPVSLADLRGKAVWINFWASWCPPCQAETPVLRQTAATYRDRGLAVVGISVQETNADDVRAYALKYSLGYTVAADLSGDIFHLYRVYALPTQFFIDPQGRISSIVQGPLDAESAAAHVEAILPKG
jgi:peroxiredoxin